MDFSCWEERGCCCNSWGVRGWRLGENRATAESPPSVSLTNLPAAKFSLDGSQSPIFSKTNHLQPRWARCGTTKLKSIKWSIIMMMPDVLLTHIHIKLSLHRLQKWAHVWRSLTAGACMYTHAAKQKSFCRARSKHTHRHTHTHTHTHAHTHTHSLL